MRGLRVMIILAVAALAAAPLLAQSFTEEFEDITTLTGAGWFTQNNSTGIGTTSWGPISLAMDMRDGGDPDFQGNTAVFPAYSGAGYIADNYNATTGASTISDWLMTPVVTIQNGDTVSFWTRSPTGSTFPDRLELRMSLAGTSTDCGTLPDDVGDFTTLLVEINPTQTQGGYPEVWTQFTAVVAGVGAPTQGRFALHYYVTNGGPSGSNSDYIGVDLFEYVAGTAAPPNDLCSDAAPIDCNSSIGGTTVDATFTNQGTCDTSHTAPEVWYQVTGTGGLMRATTCSALTNYDTKLTVWDGGCGMLGCVGGDDDDPTCPFNTLQSTVEWMSVAGQDYYIMVHGFSSGTGDFELTLTCEAAGPAITLTKTVGTVPAVCAATDAITVSSGTPVFYCYEVENVGDVTFEYHTLEDDQLGQLLLNAPVTLAPGATYQHIEPAIVSGASVTNTGTWTAVDSIGGYAVDDAIPFVWVDISGTGTPVGLSDDSTQLLPIGFTFDYYSVPYTNIEVSSNGFLSVNAAGDSGCCTGDPLPDVGAPNGVIAGWWEDLNPSAGGTVHYETLGTAPNQVFIVQFTDIQHFGGGNPVTLQYKLFEGSNVIQVHYLNAPSDGGTHSAGIENQDGTVGIQYYLGTDPLAPPEIAVQYAPTMTQEATAFDTATVNISDPDIDVTPTSLASSLLVGTMETQQLTIANVGSATLDWNLEEAVPSSARFPQMPNVAGLGDDTVAEERSGAAVPPMDPDATNSPAGWTRPQVVLYDNGPLITHPGGGAGGADASALQTALGLGTYGFGHQVSAGNRIADDFTITDASGWTIETITFFAYQTGSTTTSTMTAANLQIWDGPPDGGGTVIWGDPTTNVMTDTTWSNIYRVLDTALTDSARPIMANTVTVNIFLPAGTYWLDWQTDGTLTSGPWAPAVSILGQTTTGNALQWTGAWAPALDGVDQQGFPFIIEGTSSNCYTPSDIPWLSASPTVGSIPAAGSTPVDVTFDATGVPIGTYDALLCVFSNDPDEPLVEVPVQMEVVIPVELMSFEIE